MPSDEKPDPNLRIGVGYNRQDGHVVLIRIVEIEGRSFGQGTPIILTVEAAQDLADSLARSGFRARTPELKLVRNSEESDA